MSAAVNFALIELLTATMISAVIFWGTIQAIDEGHSAGHLLAFFAALGLLMSPAKRLASAMQPLQKGIAAAESIFGLLDLTIERDTGILDAGRLNGDISMRDVTFGYIKDKEPVLQGVTTNIDHGTTVALVGHSGSGKSTIAALLPRFYDIAEGSIQIDGTDIREFTLQSLRDNIAEVSQDVVLFNDTVRANITYGMIVTSCHQTRN